MTLVLATEGPCKGHACDNCPTCQKGRCCRRDNPHYRLPELGEWDGPIYGELGVLNDDGDRVECHCCGGWFRRLYVHAWHTHNLTAREYKSMFGLAFGQPLVSSASHQKQSESFQLVRHRIPKLAGSMLTPEQNSAQASRPKRLQVKLRRAGRAGNSRTEETRARISQSAQGIKRGSSSRFLGVYWDNGKQRWAASVRHREIALHLGRYDCEIEAARAYDAKARELYGDAARLNFPGEQP